MADLQSKNDKELDRVVVLNAWKRMLMHDREAAIAGAQEALKRLVDAKLFHHTEIARFYAQMLNGCAVPGDFARGQNSLYTRA